MTEKRPENFYDPSRYHQSVKFHRSSEREPKDDAWVLKTVFPALSRYPEGFATRVSFLIGFADDSFRPRSSSSIKHRPVLRGFGNLDSARDGANDARSAAQIVKPFSSIIEPVSALVIDMVESAAKLGTRVNGSAQHKDFYEFRSGNKLLNRKLWNIGITTTEFSKKTVDKQLLTLREGLEPVIDVTSGMRIDMEVYFTGMEIAYILENSSNVSQRYGQEPRLIVRNIVTPHRLLAQSSKGSVWGSSGADSVSEQPIIEFEATHYDEASRLIEITRRMTPEEKAEMRRALGVDN